jgi:hypothetical protein
MAANEISHVNDELNGGSIGDFDDEFGWACQTAMTPPRTDVSERSDCANVEIERVLEQTIPNKLKEVSANSAPQPKSKGGRGVSQNKRKANQGQSYPRYRNNNS